MDAVQGRQAEKHKTVHIFSQFPTKYVYFNLHGAANFQYFVEFQVNLHRSVLMLAACTGL
jgi:hypothetical protein